MELDRRARSFLEELLATAGCAGFEADAQEVVRAYLAERLPESAQIALDRNGSLTAAVRPQNRPRVALIAHVDTVGLIVHKIDAGGFLRVGMIGRPQAEALVGQLVRVHAAAGPVPGVVFRAKDGEKKAEVEDLAIDCGFADAAAARRHIRPGDWVSWARPPQELADGRIAAPATDDRVGVFVAAQVLLAAAADGRPDAPCVACCSVIQEEGPTHLGAITTMSRLRPDLILAVDTTHADDHVGGDQVRLGGGPLIARGGSVHNRTSDALLQLADRQQIPCQIEPIGRGTGTDLESALQFSGGDAIGALVSIPHRHYHSPNEVVDPTDVENAIRLLAAFVTNLPPLF